MGSERHEQPRIAYASEPQGFEPEGDPDAFAPPSGITSEFAPYAPHVLASFRGKKTDEAKEDEEPAPAAVPADPETEAERVILHAVQRLHGLVRSRIRAGLPSPGIPVRHLYFSLGEIIELYAEDRKLGQQEQLFTLTRDAVIGVLGEVSPLDRVDAKLPDHLTGIAEAMSHRADLRELLVMLAGLMRATRSEARQTLQLTAPDLLLPDVPPLLPASVLHYYLLNAYNSEMNASLARAVEVVDRLDAEPSFAPIRKIIEAFEKEQASWYEHELSIQIALRTKARPIDRPYVAPVKKPRRRRDPDGGYH